MSDQEEAKIIVDEDWKSQIEKEKEELRQKEDAPPAPSAGDIPEASFHVLLSTLATQALAMMGLLPNMGGEESVVNLPMARHLVDMVAVLEEKTKGNLTDDEAAAINGTLHQMRMAFVEVSQNQASSGAGSEKAAESPTIELP